MSTGNILDFQHVSFAYHTDRPILTDLSFTLQRGEFVALIGSNGAGKSTISRLCNGLLKPTSGTVLLDGRDTSKVPVSKLASSCGFLFQNPDRQICESSVYEEIAFSMRAQGWKEEDIAVRVEEELNRFDLKADWYPFERSRGERQRIALAGAIAAEPELLILDEPTTGLDYLECIRIMDYVTYLNREKQITVLMVSHDMELVLEYARRVLVLCDGNLLGDGETRAMMKQESLLKKARVLPPQIPELALRLGEGFEDVYTVDEMAEAVLGGAR